MTELAIRLLLPLAAGYLTFALIARQAMPWAKPTEAENRPRWVLACWLGAAVALTSTLVIYMQLAGQISAAPALIVFTPLATIGIIGWFMSRRKMKQATIDMENDVAEQWDFDKFEMDNIDQADLIAEQADQTLELSEYDMAFDQAHRDCTTAMAQDTSAQAEDGIRDCLLSRGLGDVYKRQDSQNNHELAKL